MTDTPNHAFAREGCDAVSAVFDAWDKHCDAVERMNAAIPAINSTPAERAVYDERYRASEDAKRDWYAAMHDFVNNPAARALSIGSASSGSVMSALEPFARAYREWERDQEAGPTSFGPQKYVSLWNFRNAAAALSASEGRDVGREDGGLAIARDIVAADLADATEHCDADWIGMSQQAFDAIDAALSTAPAPRDCRTRRCHRSCHRRSVMAYGDYDGPDKPNKGVEGGACNRQRCQAEPALWHNWGTSRWYCADCARDIGQDSFNLRDWKANYEPRLGHPMFRTRAMIDASPNRKDVA